MAAKTWLCFLASGRARSFDLHARGEVIADCGGRDLRPMKMTRAIAVLAIERQP
jgi:hypothetical protein